MPRVPTTVWRVNRDLVLALAERLGDPVDSYVNGSQTWILDDGPNDMTLEWRLHPVRGYQAPKGISTYEIWETVVAELLGGTDPSAIALGDDTRDLGSLWDGLECFPAFGDEVEPAILADGAASELGIPPDGVGLVDHELIGAKWEQARGDVSIVDLLFEQLGSAP